MCYTRLAENAGRKKSPKIAIWAPSHNFVGLYFRNWVTYRQSERKLLSSNTSPTCPHNMVNFGPLATEIRSLVWGTLGISTALVLQQWAAAKLYSVEQRAPPIFGRATITLGIGPHSSCFLSCSFWLFYHRFWRCPCRNKKFKQTST